ncbi:YdiU family protein [Ahrensia sp. AH-315-G08]|nr:YdiU family protein [Ahrensia sp. AH-315-G08]
MPASQFAAPKILKLNHQLALELGINPAQLESEEGAAILSGAVQPHGGAALAMVYAGHQFGGFSPQLGDGRAQLLGEVIDKNGERRDIHLKGSGRTPYSRGGDGKAALGPVLREYLIGEAMHALGIPTTRALAALTTGEDVQRETPLPGAVLARVGSSHLRVGTLQYFAARNETENVKRVADYAIQRHHPKLQTEENPYLALLKSVIQAQAQLVAKWMLVGFVHGVMNTDNMTLSGETIDYGPCAFMDHYDPGAVFSSIDQQGRYAFGRQPEMAQWNLARLAETLVPLIDGNDSDNAIRHATNEINGFLPILHHSWLAGMRHKLGLMNEQEGDADLINRLFAMLSAAKVDYTNFFRNLAVAVDGGDDPVLSMVESSGDCKSWLNLWRQRIAGEPSQTRKDDMNMVNPVYIPRNHLVEAALQAAVDHRDMSQFDELLEVVTNPYLEKPGMEDYAKPAPDDFGPYKTFCGT